MVRLCRPQHNVLYSKLSGPSVLALQSTFARRFDSMYEQLQVQEDSSEDAHSVGMSSRYESTL